MVDRPLCNVLRSSQQFCGIAVLLIGDFRKIRPVVRAASSSQIVSVCLKNSCLFQHIKIQNLQQNLPLQTMQNDQMQPPNTHQIPLYLLNLEERKLPANEKDLIRLPDSLNVYSHLLFDLIKHVFSNLPENFCDESWTAERPILTTQNERLSLLNNLNGSFIPKSTMLFRSADSVEEACFDELQYLTERLNALLGTASLPDHC